MYNFFSMILYLTLAVSYSSYKEFLVLTLVSLEIPVYSVIVTLYLGNYSGALFFPFGMLAAVFLFAVNSANPLYKYILLSLPSLCVAFFIALWEVEPFLGSQIRNQTWFSFHRVYTLGVSVGSLMYLCISGHIELASVQRKNKRLIEQLRFISNHDAMTGIPNRRFLLQQVELMHEYTVAIFDVDNFKKINDTYGHEIGDKVLCRIVRRISSVLPKDTVFARWGGEEFLIVFPSPLDLAVCTTMEQVLAIVDGSAFAFDAVSIQVSITAGVCDSSEANTFDEVLALADSRLYKGKQEGKNQVVFPADIKREE